MNRRDFLKLSGILANTIYFPLIGNKKVNEHFIESVDDFEAIRQQTLNLGDKVYFREGIYYLKYPVCNVKWEDVEVSPYKKEKVIIDGCIDIFGDYQHWDGFEILNTRWETRDSQQTGGSPTDIGDVYEAFIIDASNATITNCDLHDCRQGVRAVNDKYLAIENCRIWNNGWNAPDRGHGHGIYANVGPITIRNNWIGKGYSEWGIHVYGASTERLICEKNKLENCMLLAYSIRNGSITKNEVKVDIEGPQRFVDFRNPLQGGEIVWDHNTYIDKRIEDYRFSTEAETFEDWQKKWGFDLHSKYLREEPNGDKKDRKEKVLKKLYPGVYELNQELGDTVVRLPPAPYAVWLKDIE